MGFAQFQQKIVNLKASLNLGLTSILMESFPKTIPFEIPELGDQEIYDPNWLAGFTTAEACLGIQIRESKPHKVGLRFTLVQHLRDRSLMFNI